MSLNKKISLAVIALLVIGGTTFFIFYKELSVSPFYPETAVPSVPSVSELPQPSPSLPSVANSSTPELNESCYLTVDGKIVYNYSNQFIVSSDVASFKNLGGVMGDIHSNSCYGKDSSKVYFRTHAIKDADPATFVVLHDWYAKDKSRVYYGTETILKADPATFQILARPFAKDKNNVYYVFSREGGGSGVIENADPATFQALAGYYAKDANNVFASKGCGEDGCASSSILQGADVTTFTAFNFIYAKDKNYVYAFSDHNTSQYGDSSLTQVFSADPATFSAIDENFAKDSRYVFFYDQVIKDADLNTFVVLEGNYGKDKDSIYYGTQKIPEADLATFRYEMLTSGWSDAHDKNNFYSRGKIIGPVPPQSSSY